MPSISPDPNNHLHTSGKPDAYSHYEIGLDCLLRSIKRNHPRYPDALTYQQRLTENITKSRLYGDNDTYNSSRAEIVSQLNELSTSVLGISFNELCKPISPIPEPEPFGVGTQAMRTAQVSEPTTPPGQVPRQMVVFLAVGLVATASVIWILVTKASPGVFDGANLSSTVPAIAAATETPSQQPATPEATDTPVPTPVPVPTNTPEPPTLTPTSDPTSTPSPSPTPTDTPTPTTAPSSTPSPTPPTETSVSIPPTTLAPSASSTPTPPATSAAVDLPALPEPKMIAPDSVDDGLKFSWNWDGYSQLTRTNWGYDFRFYVGDEVKATHLISNTQAAVNGDQWSYTLKHSEQPNWKIADCPNQWVVVPALLNADGSYQGRLLSEDVILRIRARFCAPAPDCDCGGDGGKPPPN